MENNSHNNQPEKKFRAGGVAATVWPNTMQLQNGQQIDTPSVTVDRSYKDKDNKWQHSGSLKLNDIPKAIHALQQAYNYLLQKGADTQSSAQQQASAAAENNPAAQPSNSIPIQEEEVM